jgi:EmrB/QacA subfamily drug resistance transporter
MQRRALASVCAVLFLTFLDNTVISVALPNIQTSLTSGIQQLQWIVDGYMLAFAALMLTGGTLGDLFGRKRVMLGGVGLFCGGSILAAVASSNGTLIAGRVVMGVGAAASEPGTLSVLRHVFPEERARTRALAVWAAVSGAALALGPIVAGLIISVSDWRAVFWFNLAFGVLAFVAAALTVPETADREGRRFDLPGTLLGVATVTAATFGIIEGEIVGFGMWWVDLLFALAIGLGVAFVASERRAADPVLKLEFFRDRSFSSANLAAFVANWGVIAVFFFISFYLQLIANIPPAQIALQFASMAAAMWIAAAVASVWIPRAGTAAPLALGCVLSGVGILLVDAVLGPNVGIASLGWALAIVGLGFGLAFTAMTSAVLTAVPPERSGMAASTINTSRELGGVFGTAVLGAILNAQVTGSLAHKLVKLGIPADFRAVVIQAVTHGGVPKSASAVSPGAAGGAGAAATGNAKLVNEVIHAAEDAFASGLHVLLVLAAALLLAAGMLALRGGRLPSQGERRRGRYRSRYRAARLSASASRSSLRERVRLLAARPSLCHGSPPASSRAGTDSSVNRRGVVALSSSSCQ